MQEVNLNALNEFLKETVKLRHKGKTQFAITIDGKDIFKKEQKDIAKEIVANASCFKNDNHWLEFKRQYGSDLETWLNNLQENILKVMPKVLAGKSEVIKKLNENSAGSIRNSYYKRTEEIPPVPFNNIDKDILWNVRYCKADDSIYVKNGENLTLIGTLSSVAKDPSLQGLCKIIQKNISMRWNEGCDFSLAEYIKKICDEITFTKRFIMNSVTESKDIGEIWKEIKIELDGDKIFIPSKYNNGEYENALEDAADLFCIELFWEYLPASLFASRMVELNQKYTNYEMSNPDGKVYKIVKWDYFTCNMVRSGEALTELRYLKNIFSEFVTYIKDDPYFRLEEMPRTYSDSEKEVGLFNYSMENLKNNICKNSYKTIEECKNIMLFKSWMNPSEFKFAMAWAYAAIHPVTIPSNIALLLWTGGGTGKSSFVAMIKEAMKMVTNAKDSEIYFEIKGNKFDEDPRNWIPDGELGVEKAALINIDEATTDSINLYKNFSGSAAGNKLNIRKNYENARSVDIYGKFIFTTNQQLSLSSDDGSLLRRVAIISHGEIRNVIGTDKILSNKEIVEEYRKQVPMLMKIGKECYEQIIAEGFSSIDEYATKVTEINKNLKESTSTSSNLDYYRILWSKLEENTKYREAKHKKGCYRLQGGALKSLYIEICEETGSDMKYYSSFRKFIIERQELFVEKNVCKQAIGNILNKDKQIHQFKNGCCGVYHLFPLKDEYKMVIEDDDEETVDDNVNRLDEDLEYDENGEIKVDVDYTNRQYEDVVKDIIDPMLECNLWK